MLADATSHGGMYRIKTVMCVLVWILTIFSSVFCLLMLMGIFRSVNVMWCLM